MIVCADFLLIHFVEIERNVAVDATMTSFLLLLLSVDDMRAVSANRDR